MELTRVFALSVMILVASYANTYVNKPTEKGLPCEPAETAATTNPDKRILMSALQLSFLANHRILV